MAIIEYSDLIGEDSTFDDLSKNIKELEKELLDLAKVMKKTFASLKPSDTEGIAKAEKELKDLEKTQKNLVKTEKAMQVAKKKSIQLTNEELIQIQKEKLAQRERIQIAKQLAIISREEKNSIAAIRAQLSLTTLEWKKFTKEELENTKEGRKLVKNKKDLTAQLKKLEKQTGDNRRNVGNYNSALKGLRRTFLRLFVGRTIIDGIARLGGALVDIVQEGAETNDRFKALVETFGRAKEFLVGLATTFLNFIAGPLSSLVNTFLFVADAIGKASTEGSFLGTIFSGIGKIFTGVITIINNLPAIFGGVVAAARDFGTSTVNIFKRMALQLEIIFAQINKANPFSDQTTEEIDANIRRIAARQLELANESIGVQAAFKKGFDDVIAAQEEFNKQQSEGVEVQKDSKEIAAAKAKAIAEQNALLQKQNALLIQINVNEGQRLKAIEEVNKNLLDAEIGNIEDRQAQLTALEDERFRVEQAQRKAQFDELQAQIKEQDAKVLELFGAGSDELKAFREQAAKDVEAFRTATDNLEVEQLKVHQKNLLKIRKDFALETTGIQAISVQDDALKAQEALLNEEVKLVEEANKKKTKSNKELIDNIAASAQKVGEIIGELFEKQADLSEQRVEEQEGNLTRARERAAKGLSANLAFEEQELSKRQLEQQRKQKEAEQAAKILTLFNLVAAYASSGDKNALSRGLTDFFLLDTLASGLTGFYEGTENVNDGLGRGNSTFKGKDGFLGNANGKNFRFDGDERILSAAQNALLGNMSNDDAVNYALIGSQMGDYFNPQSPLQTNPYNDQKQAFKQGVKQTNSADSQMARELSEIKNHLKKQPNYSAQIVEAQEGIYEWVLRTQKQQMTKIDRKILRAAKK
jgi:hypothetical protein